MLRLPRFAAAFGGTLLCLLLVRHGRVSSDANGAGLLSGAGGLTGPYRTRCGGRAGPGLFAPAQSLELVEQFQRAARSQLIRVDLLQSPFHRGGRRHGGRGRGPGEERLVCRATAEASDNPSKLLVRRPISSMSPRLRAVALCRMLAVSVISTMKVERPPARSSPAPMRV